MLLWTKALESGDKMAKQPTCNDCALQFKDSCPNQFRNKRKCKAFVWKTERVPQPPSKCGRSKGEPGEFLDEPVGPTVSRDSISRPEPKREQKRLRCGQKLYYKNKFTGAIQSGLVTWVGDKAFWFKFDNGETLLHYSDIGSRVFFTPTGAARRGQMAR